MFTIDGRDFSCIVTALKRNFSIADGENAGRTLDGVMHRDLIGTYYNYSITIKADRLSQSKYNELYQIITAPVESHSMRVAYGNTTLSFLAYITQGSDDLLRCYAGGGRLWGNLTFDFIAMEPQRYAE